MRKRRPRRRRFPTRSASEVDDRATRSYRSERMTKRSQRPIWLGEDARGWDHVRVHMTLLRDDRVGAYELAVYLGLAAHAEISTGAAHPSIETLARYGGMSARKASDCVAALEAAGYIDVTRESGAASRYRLLPPRPLHDVHGSDDPTAAPHSDLPLHDVPQGHARRSDELEPVDENQGTREGAAAPLDARIEWTIPQIVLDAGRLDDALSLCELMAGQVEDRGYTGTRKKAASKRWVLDMEALLRLDEREPAAVRRVLDWLDRGDDDVSSFWRTNVLSPSKLRIRWQQMAEQYLRQIKPKRQRGETFGMDRAQVDAIVERARSNNGHAVASARPIAALAAAGHEPQECRA